MVSYDGTGYCGVIGWEGILWCHRMGRVTAVTLIVPHIKLYVHPILSPGFLLITNPNLKKTSLGFSHMLCACLVEDLWPELEVEMDVMQ